jgi:hypothetical protein
MIFQEGHRSRRRQEEETREGNDRGGKIPKNVWLFP